MKYEIWNIKNEKWNMKYEISKLKYGKWKMKYELSKCSRMLESALECFKAL